ncbi:hypothetical protein ACTFIZ_005758 [Dictyostelium cf. discoideum]
MDINNIINKNKNNNDINYFEFPNNFIFINNNSNNNTPPSSPSFSSETSSPPLSPSLPTSCRIDTYNNLVSNSNEGKFVFHNLFINEDNKHLFHKYFTSRKNLYKKYD